MARRPRSRPPTSQGGIPEGVSDVEFGGGPSYLCKGEGLAELESL